MRFEYCMPDTVAKIKKNRLPLIFAGGTIEYHGAHCGLGCDTMIVEGLLCELEKRKEIVIAPPVWYSPSSYAVADESSSTVHVEENSFENYVYYIYKSLLASGYRNIYTVIHHQFEQESLMPMTLSYMKAAKRATMDFLEKTRGQGWWGSDKSKEYYNQLDSSDNPFSWIKVIPTMNKAVQDATGYDHAGKFETSLLMALYPDAVDLSKVSSISHWYTESAKEASASLGKKMADLALDYLEKTIV